MLSPDGNRLPTSGERRARPFSRVAAPPGTASALTHSADSQAESGMRVWANGTDSMRVVERVGQDAA